MRLFQKSLEEDGGGINDVNMTPLIDVSLVLVVMLMLATPLAFESSLSVKKTETSGEATTTVKEERVEVRLLSDERVEVNREMVSAQNLRATLAPLLLASVPKRVVISCENGVSHGAFVHALDVAKGCGAADIAVVGS